MGQIVLITKTNKLFTCNIGDLTTYLSYPCMSMHPLIDETLQIKGVEFNKYLLHRI